MTMKFSTKAEFLEWVDSHDVLHYSLHGLLSEYESKNTANPEKIRELCDRLNFTEFEEYPPCWAAKSKVFYLMVKPAPSLTHPQGNYGTIRKSQSNPTSSYRLG